MRLGALLLLLAVSFGLAACGGGETVHPSLRMPGSAAVREDPFSGGYPTYADEQSGLRLIFGTPDLGAGTSRVAFALFDEAGLIAYPGLVVRTYLYPDGPEAMRIGPLEQAVLRYHPFPYGTRGTFTGELAFATAGLWGVEVAVPRPDGSTQSFLFPVEVAERSRSVAVGAPAPRSRNRIAADVPSLAELTTSYEPDPALYAERIVDAAERGRPFVVTFASPAFCTTALCGPQVELLSELAPEYGARLSLIHVDLYENPHEIGGDLARARRTPILDEWGVAGDQWTFVVGADGRVHARFESFVGREELEPAILAVLGGG